MTAKWKSSLSEKVTSGKFTIRYIVVPLFPIENTVTVQNPAYIHLGPEEEDPLVELTQQEGKKLIPCMHDIDDAG